jgi:NAD(P)-dependent dehydrogenase (short-subunit alcohol dehydrogenase family)
MLSSIKTALIVGGTGGIGYGIACRVAADAPSALVVISGRTKPENIPHSNIKFKSLDASSMRSIKAYTDEYKSSMGNQDQRLDLLVLSQGILSMNGRTETSEGLDRKMALHYYGRQLLIRELAPVLKDDAKVILVLDGVRGSPDKLVWEDLDLKTHYSLGNAASNCISMTDAMIQEYAAEQEQTGKKRHFVHSLPGLVATGIANGLPWYLKLPATVLSKPFSVSPAQCADYMLKAVYEDAAAAAAAGGKENALWSCIDEKGRLLNAKKAIWTKDQRETVAKHTWTTVDNIINAPK